MPMPEIPFNQKTKAACFFFASSDGERSYQTLLYTDGTTSCDCMQWCRRPVRKPDGTIFRDCKHCRSVMAGLGESEARKVIRYTETLPTPVTPCSGAESNQAPDSPRDRAFDFSQDT